VLGEKDGKLPENVEKAVNYISIDDARFLKSFPPVFMDSRDERKRVQEVWFPGQHGDVGGGKYDNGVANGAGECMQEWLKQEGGIEFITPEEIKEDFLYIPDKPNLRIDPSKLTMVFNPADRIHTKPSRISHRPLGAITNGKVIEGAIVNVHVNALKHANAMKENGKLYNINPEVIKAKKNIAIVNNRGEKLESETKEFKQFLDTFSESSE